LKGLSPDEIAGTPHHLNDTVISGALANLNAPERMLSTSRWALRSRPNDESAGSGDAPEANGGGAESVLEAAGDDLIEPETIGGVDNAVPAIDEGVRPGILVGAELANSLQVDVGSEVTLISPRDGVGFLGIQPKVRSFRVAGVFRTGMYEFDLKLAYCSLNEAQRFFNLGSEVNRIELRLSDVDSSQEVVEEITASLKNPHLEVLDWKHLNKNLFSALQLEKIVMFVVLAFIILVASFNIVGSLIMIILEKAKEIAILKSMGTTSANTRGIFLIVGSFIGLIGSVAGLTVGLTTCWIIHEFGIKLPRQYYIEMLPVHVDPYTVLSVFFAGILICLLATVYPAAQAARLKPVEGLRFD
jgi:lipoprotein-releasing system permease protein